MKELLKIARVLYNAVRACQDAIARGEEEADMVDGENLSLNVKSDVLSSTRALASEVTERGARLYELLRRDEELRPIRANAIRFLDSLSGSLDSRSETAFLERSIRDAIASARENLVSLERQLQEATEDERALEAKVAKRSSELERSQKRLESLLNVRPAFMDEYERLERELAEEHEQYVLRYRNLDYLQHELEMYDARDRKAAESSAKSLQKLQRRLQEEELRLSRGDEGGDDSDGEGRSPGRRRTAANQSGRQSSSGLRPTGAPGGTRPGQGVMSTQPPITSSSSKIGAVVGGAAASHSSGSMGGRAAAGGASAKPSLLSGVSAANASAGRGPSGGAIMGRGGGGGGANSITGGRGVINKSSGGGGGGGGGGAKAVGRMNAPVDDDEDDDEDDLGDDDGESGAGGDGVGDEEDDDF